MHDLMASLLLPSVRVFSSCLWTAQAALLTACALRQVGYQHTWVLCFDRHAEEPEDPDGELSRALRSIAGCCYRVADESSEITSCGWTFSQKGRLP
jgi:hypothetical protein